MYELQGNPVCTPEEQNDIHLITQFYTYEISFDSFYYGASNSFQQ